MAAKNNILDKHLILKYHYDGVISFEPSTGTELQSATSSTLVVCIGQHGGLVRGGGITKPQIQAVGPGTPSA